MTIRRRRRSSSSAVASFFFSSSSSSSHDVAVLRLLLVVLFVLGLVIAPQLSSAAEFDAENAGVENAAVELNAAAANSVNSSDSSNGTLNWIKEDSLADMIDRALDKEFAESDDHNEVNDAGSFNNSVAEQQDNVFIISNFKSKYPVLQLDLGLISDLVVVIVSATCGGTAFACVGQPGSIIRKHNGTNVYKAVQPAFCQEGDAHFDGRS